MVVNEKFSQLVSVSLVHPCGLRHELRPFAYWDFGFESHWGHACLSFVSVVCYQVEVSALGWPLVQRSPTDCGVYECDREVSKMGRPWTTRGCRTTKKNSPPSVRVHSRSKGLTNNFTPSKKGTKKTST